MDVLSNNLSDLTGSDYGLDYQELFFKLWVWNLLHRNAAALNQVASFGLNPLRQQRGLQVLHNSVCGPDSESCLFCPVHVISTRQTAMLPLLLMLNWWCESVSCGSRTWQRAACTCYPQSVVLLHMASHSRCLCVTHLSADKTMLSYSTKKQGR